MILFAVLIYVVLGLAVGLGFVLCGVYRIDPVAGASPMVFRFVILPGCVGLWPVVLVMWWRAEKGRAS